MAYILGEHLIVCAKCRKEIFRSEAIRSDITGLLYCKEGDHADFKWSIPKPDLNDPISIPAHMMTGEEQIRFITSPYFEDTEHNWEDIEWTWESIDEDWEDI